MSKYRGEAFNIGSGKSESINNIFDIVVSYFPESVKNNIPERPGQVLRHTSDSSKAKEALGWNPIHNIRDSMSDVVSWYKANTDVWNSLILAKSVNIEIVPGVSFFH